MRGVVNLLLLVSLLVAPTGVNAQVGSDPPEAGYGHAGYYSVMKRHASLKGIIESDHAPQYLIIDYVDKGTLQKIPKDSTLYRVLDKRRRLDAPDETAKEVEELEKKIVDIEKDIGVSRPSSADGEDDPATRHKATQAEIDKKSGELNKLRSGIDGASDADGLRAMETAISSIEKQLAALSLQSKAELGQMDIRNQLSNAKERLTYLKDLKIVPELKSKTYSKKIKNAMATFSLPYKIHRAFPTTGRFADAEINQLQDKDASVAKICMQKNDALWEAAMKDGIEKGIFGHGATLPKTGAGEIDLQQVWADHHTDQHNDIAKLKPLYNRRFLTRSIYFLKSPGVPRHFQLIDLYLSEYRRRLESHNFESYKFGLSKLLELHQEFGWIDKDGFDKLSAKYGLAAAAAPDSPGWRAMDASIEASMRSAKLTNECLPGHVEPPPQQATTPQDSPATVCARRRKRASASSGCIYVVSKSNNGPPESAEGKRGKVRGGDGRFPPDADTVSIRSRELGRRLDSLSRDKHDIDALVEKNGILAHTARNLDKLDGSKSEVEDMKRRVKVEVTELNSQKIDLAQRLTRGGGQIPAGSIATYKDVRVSPTSLAKTLRPITSPVNRFGRLYGKYTLLTVTVEGFRNNDYGSLIIPYARFGSDYVFAGLAKVGRSLAGRASLGATARLGARLLAKSAGPFGGLVDAGFSIKAIVESSKQLNDPSSSKYDQRNAINEIIAESVNIATTIVTTTLSLIFPPLAPLFMAINFVVSFGGMLVVAHERAANRVRELEEEIPLLDFEQESEYLNGWAGSPPAPYLERLVILKGFLNLRVNQTVQFLEEQDDFIGLLTPAPVIRSNSSPECHGEREVCVDTRSFHFKIYKDILCALGIPRSDVRPYVCDTSCAADNDGCTLDSIWGDDAEDSKVDLRQMQMVYRSRVTPKIPSGYHFICNPTTLAFKGLALSAPFQSKEYLCDGAMGIRRTGFRSRAHNGTLHMKYDLGEGRDELWLSENETTNNLHIVRDGSKTYYGNLGDDVFHVAGPCTRLNGLLDGRGYSRLGNSLILGPNCRTGERMEIDLQEGYARFGGGGDWIHLQNIHIAVGRRGQEEMIISDCSTKRVDGGGGTAPHLPDLILLPNCGEDEGLSMSVLAKGYTQLDADKFSHGSVITIIRGEDELGFVAKLPVNSHGQLVLKFENVGRLHRAVVDGAGGMIELGFGDGGDARLEFIGDQYMSSHTLQQPIPAAKCDGAGKDSTTRVGRNDPLILMNENDDDITRVLQYNMELGTLAVVSRLDTNSSMRTQSIRPYRSFHNVFHLISGGWSVGSNGDEGSSTFVLGGSGVKGRIDGGHSGHSSLYISQEVDGPIYINMPDEVLRTGQETIRMQNIFKVSGRASQVEHILTDCSTRQLVLGGGVEDFVELPPHNCPYNLTIIADGAIFIEDKHQLGLVNIHAGYGDKGPCPEQATRLALRLSLARAGNNTNANTNLLVNHGAAELVNVSGGWLSFSGNDRIELSDGFPNLYLEEDRGLRSELRLQVDGSSMISLHEINIGEQDPSMGKHKLRAIIRRGSNAVRNIFTMARGEGVYLFGGSAGNDFHLLDNASSWVVHGSNKDRLDSILLSDSINGQLIINYNSIATSTGRMLIRYTAIDRLVGRRGKSEHAELGCGRRRLELNGGSAESHDTILIPKMKCPSAPHHTLIAVGFTSLTSEAAEAGRLDILVRPDDQQNMVFRGRLNLSSSNTINLNILYPPQKLASASLTVSNGSSITITMAFNGSNSIQLVQSMREGSPILDRGNINIQFVDSVAASLGTLLLEPDSRELYIQHVLEDREMEARSSGERIYRGAVGMRNIFHLNSSHKQEVYGGKEDDYFLLNNHKFKGVVNGLGGLNALLLHQALDDWIIAVNLVEGEIIVKRAGWKFHDMIKLYRIQMLVGRKGKKDEVIAGCDTRLVQLGGGGGGAHPAQQDLISINSCKYSRPHPEMKFVIDEHTDLTNDAEVGNFTYEFRSVQNVHMELLKSNASHTFIFRLPLTQLLRVEEGKESLGLIFRDGNLSLPTGASVHFIEGPGLAAQLSLSSGVGGATQLAITATSPFSDIVNGVNGTGNYISLSTNILAIIGGDEDDAILLSNGSRILLLDGRGGNNRLTLSENLLPGSPIQVDLARGEILSSQTGERLVTAMRNISLFRGRSNEHERVILGCNTRELSFAEEMIITHNCNYTVSIHVEPTSRLIFRLHEDEDEDDAIYSLTMGSYIPLLRPSTFHYHFSKVHSWDMEVESFETLGRSRHVFHLNLTIAQLSAVEFSQNESRLIYSYKDEQNVQFSHLVAPIDPEYESYYSLPEFVTADGFQLLITKHGSIIAVMPDMSHDPELGYIRTTLMERLSAYSSSLQLTFMLASPSHYIYGGTGKAGSVLTNLDTQTSHLFGSAGTSFTVYASDKEVLIYLLDDEESEGISELDLTQIVRQIRNGSKHYVPAVEEVGEDLVISMTNHTAISPGNITLVNGTRSYKLLILLLNSVAMELVPGEGGGWAIKPKTILIPEGQVILLSPADLEDGLNITTGNQQSNVPFDLLRDEKDIIFTNVNSSGSQLPSSLIIADFYGNGSRVEGERQCLYIGNENFTINLASQSVAVGSGSKRETPQIKEYSHFGLQLTQTMLILVAEMKRLHRVANEHAQTAIKVTNHHVQAAIKTTSYHVQAAFRDHILPNVG